MVGDDDEMFMTRSLNVMPRTTKHHLIVRSVAYVVAYVTNNKRVRSTFCTIKLTTDRHEASRGLLAIAQLLIHNMAV